MIENFTISSAILIAIIGGIVGALGTILLVIGVIIVIIIGMFIAWKNNFLGMKAIVLASKFENDCWST